MAKSSGKINVQIKKGENILGENSIVVTQDNQDGGDTTQQGGDAQTNQTVVQPSQTIELHLPSDKKVKRTYRGTVGYNINSHGAEEIIFVSKIAGLRIFGANEKYIGFQNHLYKTNNVEEIKFLREHVLNGDSENCKESPQFWEGAMPGEIKAAIDEREKSITRDKGEYEGSLGDEIQ